MNLSLNSRIPCSTSFVRLMATVVVFGLSAISLQAQIIFDTFDGTNGTWLSAHTPNTDLPGASYIQNADPTNIWGPAQIQSATAQLNTDRGVGISLASSGGYTKPANFTISADMNLGTVTGTANGRGVGLGFFNTVSNTAFHGNNNFLGLVLLPSGILNLISVDATTDAVVTLVQSLPYSGIWNAAVFHSLSYDVDTTTGNISNVVLDSTGYAFNSTSLFTNAATAYAGFIASSATPNGYGYIDNFSVVPEPSAVYFAAFALVLFAGISIRKRFLNRGV